MKYPLGLPADLERSVEAARDAAELALLERLSKQDAYRLNEAFQFVTEVFRAFFTQACQTERQGAWSATEVRVQVERFLEWELVPHAYDLAGLRTFSGQPNRRH